MEIKDLTGLSEPLKRLIEVVSNGIGAVCSPYLIRRNAEARAHEIKVIADALGEVAAKHKLPVVYKDGQIELWQKPEDQTLILESTPLEGRSALRLEYQERKRQHNIESVTSVAAAELADETQVPTEAPNEDWVTRFFSSAQDVSSEQMQDLWGRILAGEVKRPGSYSLRTLDFIRNLSTHDAKLLEHVGRFAMTAHGTSFIPMCDKKWLSDNRNVHYEDLFALAELGVLYPTDLELTVFGELQNEQVAFFLKEYLVNVNRAGASGNIPLSVWKFTSIGSELLPLIPQELDNEFIDSFADFFTKRKAHAVLGHITERLPNDQIRYSTVRDFRPPEPATPKP